MRRSDVKTCSVITGVFLALIGFLLLVAGLLSLSARSRPAFIIVLLSVAALIGAVGVSLIRGASWLAQRLVPERHHSRKSTPAEHKRKATMGMGLGVLLSGAAFSLIFLNIHYHWIKPYTFWNQLPGLFFLLGTGFGVWGSAHLARYKGYPTVLAYGTLVCSLLLLPLFGAARIAGGTSLVAAPLLVLPLLPMVTVLVLPTGARARWHQ